MESLMEFTSNEDVIDVGCGSGDVTSLIRRKTLGEVWGIDISPEQIRIAVQKSPGDIHYEVGALGSLQI